MQSPEALTPDQTDHRPDGGRETGESHLEVIVRPLTLSWDWRGWGSLEGGGYPVVNFSPWGLLHIKKPRFRNSWIWLWWSAVWAPSPTSKSSVYYCSQTNNTNKDENRDFTEFDAPPPRFHLTCGSVCYIRFIELVHWLVNLLFMCPQVWFTLFAFCI